MKGEALITIKTKDGKIKQQVKSNNVVFDIPKEILKEGLKNIDKMRGSNWNSESNRYCNWGLPYAIVDFYNWFKCIRVYDENCSTTDFKDVKYPVLFGGTKTITGKQRYALVTDNTSGVDDPNILKFSWTWNNCPNFNIKCISLCHDYNVRYGDSYRGYSDLYHGVVRTLGNMLWCEGKYSFSLSRYLADNDNYGSSLSVYINKLYKFKANGKYRWKCASKEIEEASKYFATSSDTYAFPTIFPTCNNEIVVLNYADDLNVSDNNNSYFGNVIVVDALTGLKKRSFNRTAFGVTSSSTYIYRYAVITTDFGNYLYDRSAKKIYTIPDNANDTPEVFADLSENQSAITYSNQAYYRVLNNMYYEVPSSISNDGFGFKINSATTGDVTIYNYAPVTTYGSNNQKGQVANKYYDLLYKGSDCFEYWYNSTALNLTGSGVEVEQGDTVTIEYTITAN